MHLSGLWRVRAYVRPYAGAMAAMVIAAFAGLFAATAMPLVTKAVVDGPVARHDTSAVWPLALLALGLGVFEGASAMLRRFVLAHAATGMETDIRNDLYAHLQRLPISFHDRWQSGQLLSRAVSDPVVIRRFIGFGLVFLVVNIATFATVIVLLLRMHVLLGLVVAASAVPIFWLSARFERSYGSVSRRLQDEEGDLTTQIEEGAGGVRVIKAFGRRQLMLDKFASGARVVYGSSMEKVRLRARFWSVLSLIPNLTLAVVLLGGAVAVGHRTMSLGELAAFISLTLMLVWPIESLGEILAMAEEAATATTRVFEIFDTEPDIVDRPDALALTECAGRVRFESVGFAYTDRDNVLRDIDLEIAPGETLALVGATGSGKTTLASLVPRLYDVTSGRLTIDGHDVRDLTLESLRRHVAVAFEDPVLFSASVRENVILGCPDATDEDVDRALDVAQAHIAYDLPWGLDTRVGEQGLSLSGGQRQRLALARAVIGRPRVLVLDDPLSALDVHTEALVEEALKRVLAGTTALLVVHRPSTVALADRVALLQDGTITAVGTHSELLDRVPAYREILSQQAEEIAARDQEVA
ncbi:MAG TPA: ABC transporter ATP-binding protein [Acidimicrobiales bacterium]|nr:ABC transporter ATP-binding protein [Acidimicrobiales bacterium]